mmetsp:Transcript_7987/g.18109  ORF Transcript_7987/g.18109 Transcript_7987/m.18109 type:complete len:426 (-) Transcript_7987:67-1344(-)
MAPLKAPLKVVRASSSSSASSSFIHKRARLLPGSHQLVPARDGLRSLSCSPPRRSASAHPAVDSSYSCCASSSSASAAASSAAGAEGMTYKSAGVDIDAGAELVRRIQKLTKGDVSGGFGGLYPFGDSYLVAGTDGVGTKLKLAFLLDKHDTIGVDLVAMSVNDIITVGALPMFFLDYFATSKLDVDMAESVIAGIVDGCRQSSCTLLGGETAEMPGFYAEGEYDLSGFAVGSVKQDALVDGKRAVAGDVVVGLRSSGVHSNGYSLARRVVESSDRFDYGDALPGDDQGRSVGEALLCPTRIYVPAARAALGKYDIKAMAHITGGGFYENFPRCLPDGLGARFDASLWSKPAIFSFLQDNGRIADAEMFRTFNMGVGYMMVVDGAVARQMESDGYFGEHDAVVVGEIVATDAKGEARVEVEFSTQ